jgi:hemoglobin
VAALLDETVLASLLACFYARVRRDTELGPVFNDAVQDWREHVDRLADFWSSVMLTTGRYKGNPVVKHRLHARRITPAMFERWLALWVQTTNDMLPPEIAAVMQRKAVRMAETLRARRARSWTGGRAAGSGHSGIHIRAFSRRSGPRRCGVRSRCCRAAWGLHR